MGRDLRGFFEWYRKGRAGATESPMLTGSDIIGRAGESHPIVERGDMVIRLEPMDEATYSTWRASSIQAYAQEKVDAGHWLEVEAAHRAEREFAALLPDGRDTGGHAIRSIVNGVGERVGMVWFATEDRPFGRVAFIYDIAIEPAHRRHGYAQAALEAVEAYAREHGCVAVQLHVFGSNAEARRLYLRAGYVETDITMLKTVAG